MKAIAGLAWVAAVSMLIAARVMTPGPAAVGVAVAGVLAVAAWRRRSAVGLAAAAVALAGCLMTAVAAERVASMPVRWSDIADRQAARGAAALAETVAGAADRARDAARDVASAPGGAALFGENARSALFRALADARGRADALFALGGNGELLAWAGRHQGPLPDALRGAAAGVAFGEGPLFDYLYAVEPGPADVRVVGAVLLETDPALGDRAPPSIASIVAEATGARPRFRAGPGPPSAAWRLVEGERQVAHATLDIGRPADWRVATLRRARLVAVALAAAVLALALVTWLSVGDPPRGWARFAPIGAVAVALAAAPQPGQGGGSAFHPAMFLVPLGDGLTLWGVVVLAAPLVAASAVWSGGGTGRGGAMGGRAATLPGVALAGVLIAGTLAAGAWALASSTSDGLYRAGAPLWWGVQVAATAILGAACALLLPRAPASVAPQKGEATPGVEPTHDRAGAPPGAAASHARGAGAPSGWYLAGGLLLAAGMAAALALARPPWAGPAPWAALAWAAPAALVAWGARHLRAGGLRRWLLAGALAATAVLPQLWLGASAARIRGADAEVERLAATTDPFLEFLMRRFADEARDRFARRETGPALLYRAWVGSGLAAEAYPLRLALWTPDGQIAERLDVTASHADTESTAPVIAALVDAARQGGAPIVRLGPAAGVRGGAAAPLDSGWVVSALVLPRRSLSPEGLAAAALSARPLPASAPVLTLSESTSSPAVDGGLEWARSAGGVRGEGEVRLQDAAFHAHVELDQDPPAVRVARGLLLLVFDLIVMALVWAIAHALTGGGSPPLAPWVPAPGSFRYRVTLALFLFFLAPALAFGAVAYRALAGTAEREAEATVTRASGQAAEVLSAAGGNLQPVAALVGLDVLFYQNGELLTSSRPELVELGVHAAWLPPGAHLALRSREALAVERRRSLLGRPAVAAFRRLPSGTVGVLALPGGAAATRRAELTDMLVFAVLLGALLSLALSLAAGRLLARPIGQLSRAASAVGAGRLRVRLPADRRDEFGELFRSFNRMTRRLRRARTRELRSARVLAWGEMARQVAHEIKNPLTPIRLSVQHVRRAYRDGREDFGEILESNVEQVLHEIDRLSDIARAFARYGAPSDGRPALEPIDVAAVVRDVESLYASGEAGFALRVSAEPSPRAAARDGELREVLINLLENARAAIGRRGTVSVRVGPDGDGGVAVEVVDDGEGIAPEVLPSVFDPQFSTRSSGTGLGLAIVKRLVEGWGGNVDVESEPGVGSTFRVRIPAAH